MRPSFYAAVMATALLLTSPAHAAKIIAQGPSEEARTDRFVLRPDHIGHDFLIKVTAPPVTIQPGQKYPVIYALDGGYDLVPQASYVLSEGRAAARAFVVSVGYQSALGPTTGPRGDDMAYTMRQTGPNGLMSGGGGAAFEAFLLEELKPFIAARYPVDPANTVLIGHSQGALFAANLLVKRPDAYAGWMIGSLPLRFDQTLLPRARALAAGSGPGARVFVTYAPEDVAVFGSDGFAQALSGPTSPFQVKERRVEGATHLSSYLTLVADGLPYVLPPSMSPARVDPNPVVLEEAAMDRLTGVYRMERGVEANIKLEGGKLVSIYLGQRSEFTPASDRELFIRGSDVTLTFDLPSRGKARAVTVTDNGASARGLRIR